MEKKKNMRNGERRKRKKERKSERRSSRKKCKAKTRIDVLLCLLLSWIVCAVWVNTNIVMHAKQWHNLLVCVSESVSCEWEPIVRRFRIAYTYGMRQDIYLLVVLWWSHLIQLSSAFTFRSKGMRRKKTTTTTKAHTRFSYPSSFRWINYKLICRI